MTGISARKAILACGAAVALAMTATPALAQQRTFDLPAQSATRSIPEFARQAGVQIIAPGARLRGIRTPALRGDYDVREALRRLIEGTGLRIISDEGSTITLGEDQAGSAAADRESVDAGATPEILVVGQRSQNVDIRRTENDPQPYVVYERTEINQSGVANLEDFFLTRLPMNTLSRPNSKNNTQSFTSASTVTLRGLPANQTLILLDGRRLPRVVNSGSDFTQADINGIPLESIERIEVLPATAGGIYGGGAVGGVINIIQRRDYSGIVGRVTVGGAFTGGAESFRLELSGAFSPNHGRTQFTFSGSRSLSEPLYAEENDLFLRGRRLYEQFVPNQTLLGNPYTPNIRSQNGLPLIFDNGTPLGSNHTFVPVGYAGVLTDRGAALLANAGKYNVDLSNDAAGRRALLSAGVDTTSANFGVRHALTQNIDLYTNVYFTQDHSTAVTQIATVVATLPADAPNNPFTTPIQVAFPVADGGRPREFRSQTLMASGGAIARIARGWALATDFSIGRSRTESSSYNTLQPSTLYTVPLSNGTLNVVRDLNLYPISFSPFITGSPAFRSGPYDTVQRTGSLRLSGTPLHLPGGPLTFTALAEYRSESASENRNVNSSNPSAITTFVNPARSQRVLSGYGELRAPLIGEAQSIPLVRSFELQASVRQDDYSTRFATPASASLSPTNPTLPNFTYSNAKVNATTYTFAALWEAVPGIRLRSSYATGFLPPSISQLNQSQSTCGGVDPRRGNQQIGTLASCISFFGGNPGIEPEQSRSLSAGAVISPAFLPNLRLSVDYTRIRKSGEIGSIPDLLINETLYPGRVVRAANLPGDQPGWPGPIIAIDQTLANITRTRVAAWDFQLDYAFNLGNLGRLSLYGVASHLTQFRRQVASTTTSFDTVGYRDGPLRWRGNLGFNWDYRNLRVGWNTQYYSSYSARFGSAPTSFSSALQVTLDNREALPSQMYSDVSVTYKINARNSSPLSGIEISGGIQNVFNQMPPAEGAAAYGYSPYGDPRLRRFWLSLRVALDH